MGETVFVGCIDCSSASSRERYDALILIYHNIKSLNFFSLQTQMTTSVDALFRQPTREGKFIKEEEFSQIQHDLHYLMQENKKLTSMIHQYQNPPPVIPISTPAPTPVPTPIPVPVAHPNVSSSKPMIYYSHDAQPVEVPEHGKTITIVIDTNKMVYLLLFIILVIMILKK